MSMASHGFGHQRSWGTFSYAVFWCILFDWATLGVQVYWVDASFSCQEHGFSDKAQKKTSLDAKSHEAWIWGFTMDLPFFTSVCEICHVGNIWKRRHSGTWHWELRAEQRDSKIEGGPCSHFRVLIFEHLQQYQQCFIWFSWPMSWKPKFVLLARAVCILVLVPEWSDVVSAMIRPNTRDHFGSLESYISKTIRPTWATSCLLLTSLRGCCVALSSVTMCYYCTSFQVVLVISNAKGLLHLGIHVFLESRLVTLNIWSPKPYWLRNPTHCISCNWDKKPRTFERQLSVALCGSGHGRPFSRGRFYSSLGFVSHLREFWVDTGFHGRELLV